MVKQPEGSKLCGAACMAMVCGYDLAMLYQELSSMHPRRTPFTMEEELESEAPMFCDVIDIAFFLAHHGYLFGTAAQAANWEDGERLTLSEASMIKIDLPIECPALVGVDSEKYPCKLHWVFWTGEEILDPNPDAPDSRPLTDFDEKIIDWWPIIKMERWCCEKS